MSIVVAQLKNHQEVCFVLNEGFWLAGHPQSDARDGVRVYLEITLKTFGSQEFRGESAHSEVVNQSISVFHLRKKSVNPFIMRSPPSGIEISEFHEDEDILIKEFEKASAIPIGDTFPFSYIRTCMEFYEKYSSRPRMFEKYRILIARDSKTGNIVGIVNAVLKDVVDGERTVCVAQMFGLKVHHHYKRRGIGTALCSQIEEELKALGAEFIFVKVESSSIRAQVLYLSRLHYRQVFHQRFNILPVSETGTRLKNLGELEAIAKTRESYTEDDMMLSDLENIFKSPHYLGTYLVENQLGEYVGASL